MRIGFLDCFAGMSSSRFIGALASAGVPEQILQDAVDALDIGARLELMHVKRSNIATIKAYISFDISENGLNFSHDFLRSFQDEKVNNKQLLGTIQALISNASLPVKAKKLILETFQNLAEAQAKISGLPIEEISFHEIKALNTIVGVTVCCVACVWLKIDQWYVSPLNVGSGIKKDPKGFLPIPTPVTLELLGNEVLIYASGPQKELLTPTCAALLKALKTSYQPCPPILISRIGYGGGRMEYDNLPNFLRLCVGTTTKGKNTQSVIGEIVIVEAEFAKSSQDALIELQTHLYANGAKFVYTVPIYSVFNQMTDKVVIFCLPEHADEMRRFLFQRLKTAYVHWRIEKYENLIHYDENVNTPWGKIKVIVGQLLNNQIVSVVPDKTTCRSIAKAHDLSTVEIEETVKRLFFSGKS
ncbi:nickel pincer cofactor biosynthesis protein LarC [Commensalibacter melissae]|uniref:nickel insertion protein n=1 Tax=Commensalibacter melissae TaxID=2070537 RepID=UPI0012D9CBC4|nr:DUF111 family protein [Commensalibacter melissae]MUH03978.1 DUF111 family protein [Commensalibacter melissae]MUH05748.1 DUF111 family protein [Commensalibacter melissae]